MDLSGNPYVIYPGDVPGDDYVEIRDKRVFISKVVWANYTDASHLVDLKDAHDREFFFRSGLADLSDIEFTPAQPCVINGLRLYTLQSGQLYIFLE